MTWRLARSLDTLRKQVNELAPRRSKNYDGTIGDAEHAKRESDHNPNSANVVQALDITHDPAGGMDSYALAEQLRKGHDRRIKYVISDGKIFSSTVSPWTWREYNGRDPHARHVHISVNDDSELYDDPSKWTLSTTSVSKLKNRGITATVFGGTSDPNEGAYDGMPIGDEELGVALPFRFPGKRPLVEVEYEGKRVVAPIVDVGPWNTKDPYWVELGRRPQAESGIDQSGRKTNKAGIDLTPATAGMIGLPGKGLVNWGFVSDDEEEPPPPTPSNDIDTVMAEIDQAIRPIIVRVIANPVNDRLDTIIRVLESLIEYLQGKQPTTGAPTMFKPILTNWKTSTAGAGLSVAAIIQLVQGFMSGSIDPALLGQVIIQIIAALGLFAAKDSNVTGGRVQQ